MTMLPHAIRRETLEVQVSSAATAFALQPRLADLHRSRLLPAIERVLDELELPDRRIRIDRLDLDLGTFTLQGLEARVEERLTIELRRALAELFGRMTVGAVAGVRALSESAAHRELLEHYLLHGTLPFWAKGGPSFSCEELVLGMAVSDPEGLTAAVRRLGQHDYVLERLVAQLSEEALYALIRLLEPRHAALILEYVADVQEVHRFEPVLPLGDEDLARVVWVVVAAYLVQDPGSQFNRKSFVKSLLEGLAASEGVAYAAILGALQVGLEWTGLRQPLRSSLPAVVAELVRELGDAQPAPVAEAAVERLSPRDAAELARLMSIFNRIPAPYRPRPEDRLRRAIVDALLARDEGAAYGQTFYTGLLAELFAWPLAEPVSRFLLEVTGEGEPDAFRAALLSVPRVDGQREPLGPRDAAELARLMEIFNRIPAPYRPRPEDRLRRVIVDALLALDGSPPGESFYAGLLEELFAWPLAEPVSRFLLEATAGLDLFRAGVLSATRGETVHDDAHELRRQASDRRTRDRWAETLPEEELAKVAALLEPRRHRELLAAAEVLAAAWRETAPPAHPALTERRAFWRFMLGFLARNRGGGHSVQQLVVAFFEHSAARFLAVAPAAPQPAAEGALLLEQAGRRARAEGQTALLQIFHRDRRVLLAPWARVRTLRPVRRVKATREPEEPAGEGKPVYIDNAGLVLAAPFLGRLFSILDLIAEEHDRKPAMRDPAAASRAIHLLQYLVDGRTNAPEPLLVLNKILCGVPTGVPIEREIEPAAQELEVCDKLLRSIIANWTAIANTSVAGLQETFFQRDGKLQRVDDGWKLEVQRKTVDFLVDAVPWNVSVISHRWMRDTLYITW